MSDSAKERSSLYGRTAEVGGSHEQHHGTVFPSGHALLDAYLDGGFQRGQLHEIYADSAADYGSAAGFAAMLAVRGLPPGKNMLWLRTHSAIRKAGRFYPAGFAELGGDPATLLMAVAKDDTALLRSAVDALRCDDFGVVVIECWGSPAILDLTASRRLTLAADRSGVTAILLRLDAREQPSTASTRWSVKAAPSAPLEANAPGYPALELTLLRRRSGPFGASWHVEWRRDTTCFCELSQSDKRAKPDKRATLSGAVVPFSASEQDAA